MDLPYDLRLGDSRDVLKTLADCSVDSVVTDPPYALESIVRRFGATSDTDATQTSERTRNRADGYARLAGGFMGQKWDTGETAFNADFWREVFRVLKPGGHLLAFSGTRTYHRLATAIEDAGFEVRDMISWAFGSGMPKSHNLHGEWEGYGTGLKPACEPICVGRKPLAGTVASNMETYGTGALNIDACRVGVFRDDDEGSGGREGETSADRRYTESGATNFAMKPGPRGGSPSGRWPANLIHDGSDEVLAIFPDNAGAAAPVRGTEPSNAVEYGARVFNSRSRTPSLHHGDTGSAARFFYSAKASKADREEGCDGLADSVLARSNQAQASEDNGDVVEEGGNGFNVARVRKNNHPTVKPTDLMRYLCRLVTPAGGIVLDPFMGSGSTGKAAVMEGFRFVGIEREENYFTIAKARVGFGLDCRENSMRGIAKPKQRPKPAAQGQRDLFAAE